jgi:hypothetical protein
MISVATPMGLLDLDGVSCVGHFRPRRTGDQAGQFRYCIDADDLAARTPENSCWAFDLADESAEFVTQCEFDRGELPGVVSERQSAVVTPTEIGCHHIAASVLDPAP